MATRARVLSPSQKDEEYFAEWDAWATKSNQAPDEKRGEAVEIMKAWLTAADPRERLSLRELNLTSLPKNLSTLTSLRELDVADNQLDSLPLLARLTSLNWLNVSGNRLPYLRTLPESLRDLYAQNNKITEVKNLPERIVTVDLSNNESLKWKSLPEDFRNLIWGNHDPFGPYRQLASVNLENTRMNSVIRKGFYDWIHNPPLRNEGGGTGGG